MPTDPGSNAKQIFLDATELPEAERAGFLERACAGDAELRERVDELLRAHQRSEDIQPVRLMPVDLEAGARVGPYELAEPIGEGGFGVVWRAVQEEPVRREVALKVIKLGMDTKQVVRRFDAERQALALMDHPGIARVFDAGATEQGRPFFVMELVHGVSITQFCEAQSLGVEARLKLFVHVCQAVQHAHQKGIIHRDLKPTNILVATQDGEPAPKVIDFGIAKATGSDAAQRTLLTQDDQFVGSPAYMSPEQMELGSHDVDTRSDVYSLGVVLYEVLTGSLPFDLSDTTGAGYYEIFRRIREQEPPRPSTRITTLSDRESAAFRMPASKLARLMRRDLDWIVMKALEKDRTRRYDSVGAFAADIARFLADEPVEASPPSALYRLRKTVRRHRVAVLSLAVVSLALALGAGLALAGFLEAREQAQLALDRGETARRQEQLAIEARAVAEREKEHAEEERDRANAVVGLLQRLLNAPGTERSRGPDYPVRDLLDEFAAGLDEELQSQPSVEATIRATIGNTYLVLDLPADARPHLERARELRHALLGPDHVDSIMSDIELARLLSQEGAYDEAEALFRERLPALEQAHDAPLRLVSIARAEMSATLGAQGKYEEAEQWARQAFEGVQPGDLIGQAVLTNNLGLLAEERGQYAQAERLYREALALHEAAPGGALDAIEKGKTLNNLGNVLMSQDRLAEAEESLRAALALIGELTGEASFLANRTRHNLGRILTLGGQLEEAQVLLETALENTRATMPADHPDQAAMRSAVSLLYERLGRREESLELGMEALALRRAALGPDHPDLASSLYNIGTALHEQGRLEEAETYLQDALRIVLSQEAGKPYRPRVLSELGLVREEAGDLVEAVRFLARSYLAALEVGDLSSANLARQRAREVAVNVTDDVAVADAFLAGQLYEEAEPRAFAALERAATDDERRHATVVTGRVLTHAGEPEEAEAVLLSVWDELDPSDAGREETARALVELYASWGRASELATWRARLGD